MGIHLVSLEPLWIVVKYCGAPQGPSGPSQAWGDGAELRGFCEVWLVDLLTQQTSSVMFTMGCFCYLANLRHPQLDPLTADRHPVSADLPSPSFRRARFTASFQTTLVSTVHPLCTPAPPLILFYFLCFIKDYDLLLKASTVTIRPLNSQITSSCFKTSLLLPLQLYQTQSWSLLHAALLCNH